MTDAWDAMISGDDAEVVAEISADLSTYGKLLAAGETGACLKIEEKYGLVGMTPEQVSMTLAEMVTIGGAQ